MKKKSASGNNLLWCTILILLLLLIIGFFLKLYLLQDKPKKNFKKKIIKSKIIKKTPPQNLIKAKIAIIIDDIGWNLDVAEKLLAINFPITLSILPHLKYSIEIAERSSLLGRELLLHIPMEPHKTIKKRGAIPSLKVSMDKSILFDLTNTFINAVPYISGVNNHQGSRFTENSAGMNIFLDVLKERNFFFIDSRTTSKSVGYKLAKKKGILTAKRQVFLDNDQELRAIEERIDELIQVALKKGSAIGIGHPYKNTITALKNMVNRMSEKDIIFVPVSELVD